MSFRSSYVASTALVVWAALPGLVNAQDNVDFPKFLSTYQGVVVQSNSRDISAHVDGKIRRIHFISGQVVKKGDLLVEFVDVARKLELARAQAAHDRAKWLLALRREELERFETVNRRNPDVISKAKLRESDLQVRIAVADLRLKEAELEGAKLVLRQQKLYAPFDGQMSEPRYRENANVDIERGTEIATIIQLDPIHVRYEVPFSVVAIFLRKLQPGETLVDAAKNRRLMLKLPDQTIYPHLGKGLSATVKLKTETRSLTVEAEFANPQQILRPGLQVTVQVIEM